MLNKCTFFQLACMLLSCLPAWSQTQYQQRWLNDFNYLHTTYAGDGTGVVVRTDASGNAFVAAQASGDLLILKYDASGNLVWERSFNGAANGDGVYNQDYPYDMELDASGNIFVSGTVSTPSTANNFLVLKYDVSGNLQWHKNFDGSYNYFDYGRAIAVDASGNVYATGDVYDTNNGPDIFTVKLGPGGNVLWTRQYNAYPGRQDYGFDIFIDRHKNVYVSGISGHPSTGGMVVLKYDSAGTQKWVRGASNQVSSGKFVFADTSGFVYSAGNSYSSNTDLGLMKLDSLGNIMWVRSFNGSANNADDCRGMKVDANSNVYVLGDVQNTGTLHDYEVLKYNPSGTLLWSSAYTNTNYDIPASFNLDIYGNLEATGYTSAFPNYSIVTVQFDTLSGTINWSNIIDPNPTKNDQGMGVASDQWGNIFMTGFSSKPNVTPFTTNVITAKIDPFGNTSWTRIYRHKDNRPDDPKGMIKDNSDNLFIAGTTTDTVNLTRSVLLKLDASGSLRWKKIFLGQDSIRSASWALTSDAFGHVYTAGYDVGSATGYDNLLIKYDTAGNMIWKRQLDFSTNDDNANALVCDASGNVYVTGASCTSYCDLFTVKYDPAGNLLWQNVYSQAGDQVPFAIVADNAGNVFVAAQLNNTPKMGVIKYNAAGTIQWVQPYPPAPASFPYNMKMNAGKLYIAGYTNANTFSLVKLDTSGNYLWTGTLAGNYSNNTACDLAFDQAGSIYTAGWIKPVNGWDDFAVAKFDTAGNLKWSRTFNGTGDEMDRANSIAVKNNRVFATGFTTGISSRQDYVSLVLDTSGTVLDTLIYNNVFNTNQSGVALVPGMGNSFYVTGSSGEDDGTDIVTIKYSSCQGQALVINGPINGPLDVCAGSNGVAYSISPVAGASGYSWSVPPGVTIASGSATNSITVNFGGAGTGNISVFALDSCGSGPSLTLSITVHSPVVSINHFNPDTVCITTPPFALPAVLPAGGSFSGPGVTGNTFDPSAAGQGLRAVVYSFTDGWNCTGTDTSYIFVDVCTGIKESGQALASVYPVVSEGEFFVSVKGFRGQGRVDVYDVLGHRISSRGAFFSDEPLKLNIANVPDGVYLVSVEYGGTLRVCRVIIQQ